jgi:hypothetical protein
VTVTIIAYQLSELLRKTIPHIGRDMGYGPIQCLRLDYDGHNLHAIATDRYTMAVARQKTRSDDPAWAATIHHTNVDVLTAWLSARTADGNRHNIHIDASENTITFTEGDNTGGLTLPTMAGPWPEWRGIFRTAMDYPHGEAPYSAITSKLLARWEHAGDQIRTWQAAATKPIVVIGPGFLGLQMPSRFTGDGAPNLAEDKTTWATSLGAGDPIEMDDTLNTWEPAELEERDNAIDKEIESLLKLTLHSTGDLFNLATGDTGALTAYALMGTQSWLAYRLVKALEKADPDLLRSTLADTSEQLESGEIGEWAWDAAEKAGHNPQQWHDEYEAHLKKLAEEKAAKPAA